MNPLLRLLMQAGVRTNPGFQAGRGGSALLRLLGGVLQNRMNTQRNFQQQMRMQDPAYQRGVQSNYWKEYNKFNTAPQPPKPPKYPM